MYIRGNDWCVKLVAFTLSGLTFREKIAIASTPFQFISSGLLSHDRTDVHAEPEDKDSSVETGSKSVQLPMSFTPTGLLSNTQGLSKIASSGRILMNLIGTSDDLPSVFEAFGVPTGLLSTPTPSLEPPYHVLSHTSKFSIRATTFDGKVVNMKRKPKVVRDARNVGALARFLSSLKYLLRSNRKYPLLLPPNEWQTSWKLQYTD